MNMEQCHEMEAISTFLPLRILLFTFLAVAIFAIPLILRVVVKTCRNSLYHRNTRLLLAAHGIALFVHHADRLVFHGWDLYRYIILRPQTSACEIISTSERCFFLRISFNSGMWFAICTTPALVLERYIATWRMENYHSDYCTGIISLIFQFLISGGLLGLVYARQSFGGTALYCMAASSSIPVHTLIAFCSTTVIQVISIVLFRKLLNKNQNLRKSFQSTGKDLKHKYQVEETVRAMTILSQPIHLMFFFQFAYSFNSFFILYFNSHFSRPIYFFLMEANIYIPEYSLLFLYLFTRKENRISDEKSESIRESVDRTRDVVGQANVYFNNYAWN